MARTVNNIITSMNEEQAAQPGLSGLTSTSQTAIYTLWKYIVAFSQNIIEQLWDIKKTELEEVVKVAPVGSDYWLQKKVLEFQYDSLVPQVLELDTVTLAVSYNPVNEAKRIISRCSVKTTGANTVLVKVATSDPPAALSAPQLAALQSYLTNGGDGTYNGRGVGIGFAGVRYIASSTTSDKLYIKGTIYYNGQYTDTISATVIQAINNYLANLQFDGDVKIISLTDAIQAVPGVNDVLLEDVAIRADATPFASKSYLIQNFTEINKSYPTYAGYAIEETTAGETFTDRLTFTVNN